MGADGSRSPTNVQHVHATARWLSPFYGGLRGRVPCFAPISSHSPQKSSNIHAIYQIRLKCSIVRLMKMNQYGHDLTWVKWTGTLSLLGCCQLLCFPLRPQAEHEIICITQ